MGPTCYHRSGYHRKGYHGPGYHRKGWVNVLKLAELVADLAEGQRLLLLPTMMQQKCLLLHWAHAARRRLYPSLQQRSTELSAPVMH